MNTILPKENRREYRLYIKTQSRLFDRGWYWNPIGMKELSLEKAESWLKADFNIWKEQPNAEYKIEETIIYHNVVSTVKEATRQTITGRASEARK